MWLTTLLMLRPMPLTTLLMRSMQPLTMQQTLLTTLRMLWKAQLAKRFSKLITENFIANLKTVMLKPGKKLPGFLFCVSPAVAVPPAKRQSRHLVTK